MRLTLVTGGARSGKSSQAEGLASRIGGEDVTFIATATASDEEMATRIRRHQRERPAAWQLIESSVHAGAAVRRARNEVVVVDCLTLLAANAMQDSKASDDAAVGRAVNAEVVGILEAARERPGILIIVTNEVGSGVHPPTAVGRWFQDALGRANHAVATAADEVLLMVCGIAIAVKGAPPSR